MRVTSIRVPDPNACPFCGWGPVVCPACENIAILCDGCGRKMVVDASEHLGPQDKRFITRTSRPKKQVVDLREWDGSDFLNGTMWCSNLITRRALDFLLSVHARPFIAWPMAVNVLKESKETLAKLERARRLP